MENVALYIINDPKITQIVLLSKLVTNLLHTDVSLDKIKQYFAYIFEFNEVSLSQVIKVLYLHITFT